MGFAGRATQAAYVFAGVVLAGMVVVGADVIVEGVRGKGVPCGAPDERAAASIAGMTMENMSRNIFGVIVSASAGMAWARLLLPRTLFPF